MRTIVIVAGIVLAGATVIAVVQNNKKDASTPEVHQADDGHGHSAVPQAGEKTLLNPAHGLAGHRCDLPVGAPLTTGSDLAPIQSVPSNTINQGPVQSATPSPATGVKLNPAHGMPGHRCDIQVGAPLS